MLRGAFIGFGNVASNGHMPGWRARDDVEIVAATDAAPSRREAFLAGCPDGRWFESVDDLLASGGIDFVDVCAPPGSHAALIERALGAGLHVMSEKPLATRLDDAARLATAAARAGRVVHTVHNWLKAPICERVTALVDAGAVGAVRSVRWATLRTSPPSRSARPGPRTGGSIRRRPAAASCSITAGMRSIASPAGPALPTASRRGSIRAASTNFRSKTPRLSTWRPPPASAAKSFSPGPLTSGPIRSRSRESGDRFASPATLSSSSRARNRARGRRPRWPKARIIPTGSAGWWWISWPRSRMAAKAIWMRRCYAPARSTPPSVPAPPSARGRRSPIVIARSGSDEAIHPQRRRMDCFAFGSQ